MFRVVLDTNVYISAVLTPGKPRDVLDFGRKRKFRLLISQAISEEIDRVLRLKIGKSAQEIARILLSLQIISEFVSPRESITEIAADPPDNRILECAVEGKADYIVSGDTKHLLPLKKYRGVKIVSPAEFLEIFRETKQ
ncbi:MAG TPA: putative toxin-antitoxin system toxin component, PIN family [Candidatus Paceibacterota bacterium]